jgi:RNA polymerase sigma-70 factor (ECF subfamily)
MEDKRIFQLLWQRAEAAIEAMTKQYGPRLYRTAMNILGRHEDAEETVSDTYLAVWDAIPPETPDPLSGYIYKTGRNLALKRLRHNMAQKRNSHYDLSLDELAGTLSGVTLEETADARALGRAIDAFLDTLNKENRIIFLRRYWFGDSVQQIAIDRGMKENAVSVRLNRIREKLRIYLTKEGYL